jgi:hypothetical protein
MNVSKTSAAPVIPIEVNHRGNDILGKRLVAHIKDSITKSFGFKLANGSEPRFILHTITNSFQVNGEIYVAVSVGYTLTGIELERCKEKYIDICLWTFEQSNLDSIGDSIVEYSKETITKFLRKSN